MESYTKVHNYDLTTEEIQTLAGGVLEVEVLEKSRKLVGDSLRFYVTKALRVGLADLVEKRPHKKGGR